MAERDTRSQEEKDALLELYQERFGPPWEATRRFLEALYEHRERELTAGGRLYTLKEPAPGTGASSGSSSGVE